MRAEPYSALGYLNMTLSKHLAVRSHDESGFGVIEALVCILLLSIMSAGIFASTRLSLRTTKLVEYNHIASSLATAKMEEIASINVSFITTANGGTESAVSWPGADATFTRVTTVVVNADNSRTVTVVVTANDTKFPTSVTFSNILALWE